MASNSENQGNLTNYQYMRLGQVISCSSMESIALGYMDIDHEKIKNLKAARRDDMEGFVRDLIREWARRHPDDQIQNLAHLFKAAKDTGYVNPREIECILGVSINECGQQTRNTDAPVTLDELETIADKMRPYTADAMKIEVAPWIRDYVVDMEELYTELALEKLHHKPIGEEAQVLNHYSELFENCKSVERPLAFSSHVSEPPAKRCRTDSTTDFSANLPSDKCDKILMKGDPGMGKTTQCKKISWDWAKKSFKHVQIVFFVSLKLVKPGDIIENVIIEQNPYMEGLKITEQKLGSILESLGRNCLLILDGLDEHALGENEDVHSIIRGKKHLKCNIIVTSRPHKTREIERYFPTVVRVEGFTRNKAREFASKILKDETVIEAVLNYNPGNTKERKRSSGDENAPIYKSPILLSFLCLLAKEDNVDLSNTKMHTGEIYLRMICCLYKKYTIRKGRCYSTAQFVAAVTSVGKLALKTLLSGNPLMRRSDVIKEIGEDAFDYGLLIGHEDFRLIRDETADIFVTFPHRSIQEFLGALYFIMMLNEEKEIQSILGVDSRKQIFLKNTLFLQFCLFLCSDQKYFPLENRQKYFPLQNRQRVYQRMVDYAVDLVNMGELNMKRIESACPALDISSRSSYAKDKLRKTFLGDILAKCNKASSLLLSHYHPINQLLGFIKPILKSITYIKHEKAVHCISCFKSTEIAIEAEDSTWDKLSDILKHYNKAMNDPVVRLYIHGSFPLMSPTKKGSFPNVKTLCLSRASYKFKDKEANEFITFSPDLTEMHLDDISRNLTMIDVISKAFGVDREVTVEQMLNKLSGGNYQNLSSLSFDDSGVDIQGKLPVLFQSVWPNLKYLSLLDTRLLGTDLEFLCFACNGPKKTLPNLTSLCLSVPSSDAFWTKLCLFSWLNLKNLYLKSVGHPRGLNRVIKDQKLVNLSCLKIRSTTTQKAEHEKEVLFLDQLTNLQSVYLDICGHIKMVYNLSVSKLSIRCTDGLGEMLSSLTVSGFPKLTTLTLRDCALESQHLASLTEAKVNGGLPVLRNLDISDVQYFTRLSLAEFKCLFDGPCAWNELLSLDIRQAFKYDEDDQVIDYLNEIVSRGYLSSLQKLGINLFESRNICWKSLEKIFLTFCVDDALRNIAETREKYLPVLQTLCVEHFQRHNTDIVRTLSELGVSCHKTCKPRGNEFSKAKCLCE